MFDYSSKPPLFWRQRRVNLLQSSSSQIITDYKYSAVLRAIMAFAMVLFLAFQATSQKFTSTLVEEDYKELHYLFKSHEVVQIDADAIAAYLRSVDGDATVSLSLPNRDIVMDLNHRDAFAKGTVIRTEEGSIALGKSLTYHGEILGSEDNDDDINDDGVDVDSAERGEARMIGLSAGKHFLMLDGPDFFLEPLYLHVDESPINYFVYYKRTKYFHVMVSVELRQ